MDGVACVVATTRDPRALPPGRGNVNVARVTVTPTEPLAATHAGGPAGRGETRARPSTKTRPRRETSHAEAGATTSGAGSAPLAPLVGGWREHSATPPLLEQLSLEAGVARNWGFEPRRGPRMEPAPQRSQLRSESTSWTTAGSTNAPGCGERVRAANRAPDKGARIDQLVVGNGTANGSCLGAGIGMPSLGSRPTTRTGTKSSARAGRPPAS